MKPKYRFITKLGGRKLKYYSEIIILELSITISSLLYLKPQNIITLSQYFYSWDYIQRILLSRIKKTCG